MYQDPYLRQSLGWRILKALSASFRAGRFFGVEVRVFWIGVVLLPLFFVLEWGRGEVTPPAAQVWFSAFAFLAMLYLVIWSHEMGHVLAARRYHVHTPLITISPLGGLAHLGAQVPTPKSDIVVSLMGPLVHVPWIAVAWLLSLVVEPDWLRPEGWWEGIPSFLVHSLLTINLFLAIFNLIPVFPLDGGRVLRAALSLKMHPNRATVIACRIGQVGAVIMALGGLFLRDYWGSILFVIGITSFLSCMREIKASRHHMGPYQQGDQRAAWEGDPDAWRRGASLDEPKGPGFLAQRKAKKAEETERKQEEEEARLAQELDRVLDRVSEVGMAGLTKAEKKVLERASKARRDR